MFNVYYSKNFNGLVFSGSKTFRQFIWCILRFIKNCKGMEVWNKFDNSEEEG